MLSEIMEMYMDRVVGEGVFAAYGRQFPVLIKTLNGVRRTPLWVHPDDGIAAERYEFLGKAKLWYVVSARPGAVLSGRYQVLDPVHYLFASLSPEEYARVVYMAVSTSQSLD